MSTLERTPLKRRRTGKPRRTLSPRCSRQRCGAIARISGLCVSHAEKEADRLFSLWVRDRDERCTAVNLFGIECNGYLQAAHIIGRRNQTLRYDPRNVHAACMAHHMAVDQAQSYGAKYQWATRILGVTEHDHIVLLSNVMTDRADAIECALGWLAPSEGETNS